MIQFSQWIIHKRTVLTALWATYDARLSIMIQFSEKIIHKQAQLRALWTKNHCISYLHDVKINCQTRQVQTVDFWTKPEKWFSEILQDSLRYQRFTIPPHKHTRHHNSIEHSFARKSQLPSVFLFAIWILKFWNFAKIIVVFDWPYWWCLHISPREAALMALSP